MNAHDTIRRGQEDQHHSSDLLGVQAFKDSYESRFRFLRDQFAVEDWSQVSMLDVACGQGGFGLRFQALGADVTFIDGRPFNLSVVEQESPGSKTLLFDLESPEPIPTNKPDVTLFLGALYHVSKPLEVLKKVLASSDNVCIETSCMDHDGEAVIYFDEDPSATSFSISGGACRTSPGWVENIVQQSGFELLKDISGPDLNIPSGPGYSGLKYDWPIERTCGWRKNECSLRRFWLASRSGTKSIFK